MPASSAASASRRLLSLLSLLQSRRDWPASALAERLGVSERTVRRDVERLRDLDYAISATRGPAGGYRLRAGSDLPPLLFDDEQAIAVALALRTAPALGAGLGDAAERALRLLAGLMPSRLGHRLADAEVSAAPPRASAPGVDPEALLRIGAAIRARREIRFDYEAPGRDALDGGAGSGAGAAGEARRLEAHHLLLRDGRWYVIGYAPDRGDWRILRADRVRLRTHTGRAFDPRPVPGGDPAAFLSARFKGAAAGGPPLADAWPCRGAVTVGAAAGSIAPFLGEGDGEAEALGPERARVRLGSWSWPALAAAFLRFDAELSEAEPAELREAFSALAGRAAGAARGIG